MAQHDREVSPELRALLDTSPDAVIIVDRAGTVVALNRRAETLFATDGEHLRGKSMEILLPERFRRSHASARAAYAASATVRAMSARAGLRGLRGDGAEFPVEVSLTPVLGSAEGLVMAVVHDVTERPRLEATAVRTELTSGALDAISDPVFTTDAHGNVEFLNRAAEALTGTTRESARGRSMGEILPLVNEASGEALTSPVAECLRNG